MCNCIFMNSTQLTGYDKEQCKTTPSETFKGF